MLGKIISTKGDLIEVKLETELSKIGKMVNYHIVFEEDNIKIIGEIKDIDINIASVVLVGEIRNDIFYAGITRKPSLNLSCRVINKEELKIILGENVLFGKNMLNLGAVPLYGNYSMNVDVNEFFSNHFAIFGNTGSGKSYSVTKILQNLFYNKKEVAVNAKIFLFDAYGEYHNAFKRINEYSDKLHFKTYTTNLSFPDSEVLKIPLWLLGVDDIALLLGADNHIQLPIIEKALRLVSIFAKEEEEVIIYKNDIIARALLEILYSGNTPSQIRDQIFAVLTAFNTKDLSLESKLIQPGYIRTLRQCLIIDRDGKLAEMQLVTEFITSFIKEGLDLLLPDGSFPYTLDDLKDAFDFALISEGILKSDRVYDYANILKVRLHSLINSDNRYFLDYKGFISKKDYINQLSITPDGKRAQIINFNINYIDDRLAKTVTKIYSKMLFDYSAELGERASEPIHIILEEAHRYVQNDNDLFLLGYNIFDRITKEGRKYGIILGLISQRPSELSETSLSQCSNFLIFRMLHPHDSTFIKNMVPNITGEIVEKLKSLQAGTCIAFGLAFKLPVIVQFDLPNPPPKSHNANVALRWYQKEDEIEEL
ncbi:MAG: ATP-binding protein [Bacilli bacterium]|jgi:DNA helicase HerA-like ATPase